MRMTLILSENLQECQVKGVVFIVIYNFTPLSLEVGDGNFRKDVSARRIGALHLRVASPELRAIIRTADDCSLSSSAASWERIPAHFIKGIVDIYAATRILEDCLWD